MSFRTIIISNKCKLNYKNNYLVIRNEEYNMIHLSEINIIVIDTQQVSITTYLITELANRKIKVIFCDDKRNPNCELVSYYGAHNSSKRINAQIEWDKSTKSLVWTFIVKRKIELQAQFLEELNKSENILLKQYIGEIQLADYTNREGHAAKVYFNSLFGKEFTRDLDNNINAALDYGYSIILSIFNKEIVSRGYLTQLGINHKNEFNFFNLSCDMMEPFRILVDRIVYEMGDVQFDKAYKYKLIDLLNNTVLIDGKKQYVSNAINIYVKRVLDAIEKKSLYELKMYEL